MEKLKELFKFLNRKHFFIEKCGINPDSGVNFWLNNKGTNARAKKTSLDEADKAKIKAGLRLLVVDIEKVIEVL